MAASEEPLLPLRAAEPASPGSGWAGFLLRSLLDLLSSLLFWGCLLYLPDKALEASLLALPFLMLLWRLRRLRSADSDSTLPYSCGVVSAGDKTLFLVATVHISPRAPRDVRAVLEEVRPDVALIELDEERLDRLRSDALQRARRPADAELQRVQLSGSGVLHGQRALWNAERAGELVQGAVVYEEENEHGLRLSGGKKGKVALVRRGGPGKEAGPFAVKAHFAEKSGAVAVLVINDEEGLPAFRLGSGTLLAELRVALATGNLGFPKLPVLLLPKDEGEALRRRCAEEEVTAEFEVMEDSYPRRTLPRRLCQGAALLFSGIGVLYGVIGCFSVEVGAEFTEAELAARRLGLPCECIDVDLNRFWSRVGAALLPEPRNVASSLLSWLALPRVLARLLFPPGENVDMVGCMLLHLKSLPARTWLAFVLAGYGASLVVSGTLQVFGDVSERGAEAAGVVPRTERAQAQTWLLPLLQAYIMPQVCQAVAASRDEAMYKSIVAKGKELGARKLVAVVGAGHANGILHYAREQGL